MQGIQPGEEYLDIVEKVGWLISLRISNRNRILKTHKTDCVSIAEIHNSAKVWITYTEYTILESNLAGVILHLRYENDIPIISRHSGIVVRWSNLQFWKGRFIADI